MNGKNIVDGNVTNLTDYKSNSNRSKEVQKEERKLEKIVKGPVVARKKSGFDKLKSELISEDAKNIKSYVFGEVLIPAIKKAISDIVTDGIDILLYGGTHKGGGRRSIADKVSYRSYYDNNYDRRNSGRRLAVYDYDNIILSSRGEAEDVLMKMDELMDTYGLVRVADLYDLVGITGNYTDNKYGWTNIRNAEIVRVRDGYMIKMPRAVAID